MRRTAWIHSFFVTAVAMAAFTSGCTEPRGELAGCTSDEQCKGERVCGPRGECVSPLALDAGDQDTSSPDDSGHDAGSDTTPTPDAGPDTTEDTSTPPDCQSAPTASALIQAQGAQGGSSVTVGPGTEIEVDASSSTAVSGSIERYEWSFVDFPYAQTLPHLEPRLDEHSGGSRVTFDAHSIGTYVLELTVVDDSGNESCNAARVEATVSTGEKVFVELVWDTPNDSDQLDGDGADLDLHYKHPDGEWGYEPLDIFWYNETADWGIERNPRDDPSLIRDDEDGAGPESVSHPQAEGLKYSVGVFYYDDYGYGESEATIRVYYEGTLAHEVSAEPLAGRDAFYEAVTIDASNGSVTVDDTHYDGYPPTN